MRPPQLEPARTKAPSLWPPGNSLSCRGQVNSVKLTGPLGHHLFATRALPVRWPALSTASSSPVLNSARQSGCSSVGRCTTCMRFGRCYEDGCTPGCTRWRKRWRTAGPAWLSEEATRNAPSRSENASNAKGLRNGSCPADGYDGLATSIAC